MKTFTPDSSIASDVIPSANFGERANGRPPDMIVLHYTGMPDPEGAIARLCTAGTDVSAHYIVLEDGRIIQSVPEEAAPGTPARLSGRAKSTSTPVRSASRSSIGAMTGAIRNFRCARSPR